MNVGLAREMIVVMPNAYNRFKGSMYSSSVTIGDWETFVSRELVNYIDEHNRTIPDARSRGLAWHSMGGYGILRLGMKYPEAWSAIYALSPCCMEGTMLETNPGMMESVDAVTQDRGISGSTKRLHERPESDSVPHQFESYEGDHLNRIADRIQTRTLPFFSEHLVFESDP